MNDLISRQAAIDAVAEITWYHQNRNNEMVSGANSELHQAWYKADDIYAALNNVPTAEKKGKWENTGECEERGTVRYICSECGRDDWHFPLSKVSYCWNCGARMEN